MSRPGFTGSICLLVATFIATAGCDDRSGGEDPGDAAVDACAVASGMEACAALDVGPMHRCAWVRTLTLTSAPQCATAEVFQCLAYPNTPAPPGCAPISGCQGSGPDMPATMVVPAYREGASGSFELVDQCASSGAVGWTTCNSGAAADAAVPACACVCESAP